LTSAVAAASRRWALGGEHDFVFSIHISGALRKAKGIDAMQKHLRHLYRVTSEGVYSQKVTSRLAAEQLDLERHFMLGYLDSNQEQKNQNLPCCQLHHTPPRTGRTEAD
jgi:hypothetical protein